MGMVRLLLWVCFLVLISLVSCSAPSSQEEVAEASEYIYLSHTRLDQNDSIYGPVYNIDFSRYKMTLLGGDLGQSSFSNDTIINVLDNIFDLDSPNTMLSPGNHDSTSDRKFIEITGKNKFHRRVLDDITFVTLDSQDSLSSIVGGQKRFLFNTLDSLQTNTVVLMSHKLIFMNDHPVMDRLIAATCNANKGSCYHCHNPNNFYEVVYPKLKLLREQGVQIIWIGGDLGYKTAEFKFTDKNGIIFLGNGMWYKKDWNKVLLFSKKPENPVSYRFVHIDTLLQNQ